MTSILLSLFKKSSSVPVDAETIMQHFLKIGFTRHQVAGAVGNAVKRGYIAVVGQVYCPSRKIMINLFN